MSRSYVHVLLLCLFLSILPRTASSQEQRITLLVLGDSLTAGYGIDVEQAYPHLLQSKAQRGGIPLKVINAGVSGDTTAGALRRLKWVLRERIDVLLVALGSNDGLRGLDPGAMEQNLRAILRSVREKYPRARTVVAAMEMPPNMGEEYRARFRKVYGDVATTEGAILLPFLLNGVAAEPHLNLSDGIHPNERGHEVIASALWEQLSPLLTSLNRELSPESVD